MVYFLCIDIRDLFDQVLGYLVYNCLRFPLVTQTPLEYNSLVRPVHWQSCAVICVLCTGSRVQSYASCAPAVICRHLVQLPLSHLVKLPLEACHAFGFAVSIQGCAIKSPTHAIPTHDPRCSPQPPQLQQVSPGEPVQGAAAFRRRRPWRHNHQPRVQSRRRLPPGL